MSAQCFLKDFHDLISCYHCLDQVAEAILKEKLEDTKVFIFYILDRIFD